jgi:glycosyltransferase involved in cell wall biosynthesis
LDFSITITTCNRADSLRRGLDALALQAYPLEKVEIIVADNGSTDHTKDVADSFTGRFPNFRYIYDARPGQMVGWHRAFAVATGTVTCFIDDDVRPAPTWLNALAACYNDPRVGLATGPIRLAYDADPPDWIASMILGEPGRQTLPLLGALDCGPSPRDIPGNFVWGTNFSVRPVLCRRRNPYRTDRTTARTSHRLSSTSGSRARHPGHPAYPRRGNAQIHDHGVRSFLPNAPSKRTALPVGPAPMRSALSHAAISTIRTPLRARLWRPSKSDSIKA